MIVNIGISNMLTTLVLSSARVVVILDVCEYWKAKAQKL